MSEPDADQLRAAAVILANDHITAELVAGLGARCQRVILLKGGSLRRLVYDPEELRVSGDIDLLADESHVSAIEAVLPDLGFRYVGVTVAGGGRARRRAWIHEKTNLPLELHTSLTGAEAPPSDVWAALSGNTEVVEIAGRRTEILNHAAAAMHLALNVAHHGRANRKTMADLDRALVRLPASIWRDAAALAASIDALPAFAAGLKLDPRGSSLLRELGLDVAATAQVALRAETAPPLAQGLGWLAGLTSTSARLRFVIRTVFPPPDYMRVWAPSARRGRLGLWVAYCWRPLWMAVRLPAAVRAWRRARRSAGA